MYSLLPSIAVAPLLLTAVFAAAVAVPNTIPKRQSADGSPVQLLIGDLRFKQITPVGISVANIILSSESGQSDVMGVKPKGTSDCKTSTDPCCIWYFISRDLTDDFLGHTGRCNDKARAAIRLGFHDAGTWSQKLADAGQDFGGADGSIALFAGDEMKRGENNGLQDIVEIAQKYQKKYKVGMADLIQYMAIHATVTCPLGPRIRAFIGRKDATKPAPKNLLPDVHSDASTLIKLFEEKTITPHDLAALLGAHTSSKQFFVDPATSGAPQDTTPGVWDVSFYNETLQQSPVTGTFRFPADAILSQDNRVKDEWVMFTSSQEHWNKDYSAAYTRLSMLGVNNINDLTECTATLPAARPDFVGSISKKKPFADQ